MFGFGDGSALHQAATPTDPTFLGSLLKGWWRADLGVTNVGGNASAWADQSGNGLNGSQGTAGNRPAIIASSINGRPALRFTLTKGLSVAGVPWASGADRILVAVSKSSTNAGGTLFSTRGAGRAWLGVLENNGVAIIVYGDAVAALSTLDTVIAVNDGTPRISQWASQVGSPMGFTMDGVARPSTGNVTNDNGTGATSVIGNYFGMDDGFPGDIAELIAISGASLSGSNQTRLSAYLSAWYGL